MRELALRDRAAQRLRDLLLGREVVDGRGAVLLDPELRSAHGFWCLARADGGFWSLARFFALRARARRKLQRALVIYGLLCCASYTVHQYRRLRADGVLGLIYRI